MILVGTGFYLTYNGIFASARHVFRDAILNGQQIKPLGLLHFLPENNFTCRPILRFNQNNFSDVAIGIGAEMKNPKGDILMGKTFSITDEIPPVGEKIFTYAYPNHVIMDDNGIQKAFFNPRFYAGEIVDFFPYGRDRSIMPWRCFQTSINLHGGASGGPVFDSKGRIFGINTSSFDGAPDVSFVASILDILHLRATEIIKKDDPTPRDYSVIDLIKLGFVSKK